jgi:hypothetical protein
MKKKRRREREKGEKIGGGFKWGFFFAVITWSALSSGYFLNFKDEGRDGAGYRRRSVPKLPAAMSAGANGVRRAVALFSTSIVFLYSSRIVEY